MKKICGILCIILSFFIIYFLQVNFFSWFNIANIRPNLFILLIMIIGLFSGKWLGPILGFVFGLILDILCNKIVGISGILFMILAILIDIICKNFSKENKLTFILILIGSTVFFETISYIYNSIIFSMDVEIVAFVKILIIEIVFNSLLTIILYPIIYKLGDKLESIFKQTKMNFQNYEVF